MKNWGRCFPWNFIAFIALPKFYSDQCVKPFCKFPNNISFSFLLQKNKPTQSATIVLTLLIYCTEDELQSCILVWRHSKERCVHCNWLIVRTFGRHNCVARATAICTSWKVLEVIVSITKFSIVIGPPRAYVSRNRRAITWVSNYSCPIWTFSNWTPIIGYPRDFHVN